MASRLVVLRQRLANTIHAALERFSEVVAPVLGERTGPFLQDGEVLFDFSLLQRVLGRMVEASFERMVAADKAHLDELTNDIAPRIERDKLVAAVRQKLIDVRGIVQGLFGRKRAVEVVAVDGETATQPDLLWRQAEHTLSRLRSPDLRLPAASTAAFAFDPTTLADELDPMVAALEASITTVNLDRRAAATSQQEKKDAIEDHDLLITACGRIVSGFYLLAQRPDLADRIRLALRPKSRTQNGDEPPASSDTEPAADSSGEPVSAQ